MEISAHSVSELRIATCQSGDTRWIVMYVYDKNGKPIGEITLYAETSKNISLVLGGEE